MTASPAISASVALASAVLMLTLWLASPAPLFVISVVLAATTLLAAISPVGGIGAVLVTLPYFHYPVGTQEAAFAASELLLLSTIAGSALAIARRLIVSTDSTMRWIRWRIADLTHSPLVILIAGLALLGGFGLFAVYDPSAQPASAREWRWTLLEPMLLIGLLVAFVQRPVDRYVVVACFLAGALAAAVHGIADLIAGEGVAVGTIRRLDGPFPHPNAFALYLLRPVVFGFTLLVVFRRLQSRWVIPAAIGAAALVGAFSRAAFLAAAVAAAILSWQTSARMRYAATAVVLVAAAVATTVAAGGMLNAVTGGSLSLRLYIWEAGLEMIRDRPVLGYGMDQFLYAYSPRYIAPEAWGERFTAHAHNLIIDFWVRLGIIGAVFAVGAVLYCVYALVIRVLRGIATDAITTAALITLVAAIVQGMVDNGYFTHVLAMSAWLLAWLAFGERGSESMEGAGNLAHIGSWWRGIGRLTSLRQPHR